MSSKFHGPRRLLPWLALLFLCVFAYPAAGMASELEYIVARTQQSFDETRAMTADFTQTVESKGFGEVEKYRGKMRLLKPLMMRWDYAEPAGRTLAVDGERLWFYDPADNVVYFDDLKGFLHPKSPALFLAGEEKLSKLFTIELVKPVKKGKLEYIRLKLTPKEPQPGLKAMLLTLDEATYSVAELLMVDYLGNRNRIEFSNADRKAALEKPEFEFRPPAGAPVRAIPKAPAE